VDVILPFLYWDDVLRRENVSAFIIQAKNDETYQAAPDRYLFDMMNPYHISFFDKNESHPVPIIRMVFALSSKTPCVTVIKPHRDAAPKANFQVDEYTAFDIWCGKASRETFTPVKDDSVFDKLLLRSRVFPDIYESKVSMSIQNATRNTNPATDNYHSHWDQFTVKEAGD
jgi:hypothetical protein